MGHKRPRAREIEQRLVRKADVAEGLVVLQDADGDQIVEVTPFGLEPGCRRMKGFALGHVRRDPIQQHGGLRVLR